MGRRFGLLHILGLGEPYVWRGRVARLRWRCECACGRLTEVRDDLLRSGRTRSCGCERVRVTRDRALRHGHRVGRVMGPEYEAWRALRRRARQGEIKVVRLWMSKDPDAFQNFLSAAGLRPSPAHRLVQRYSSRPFGPRNIVWQTKPLRLGISRRFLVVDGETLSLREAAHRAGVAATTLQKRLSRGWTEALALQPLRER